MIDREHILRMAQAAGFKIKRFSGSDDGRFPVAQRSDGRWVDIGSELAQFATLVAAAEREACLQIANVGRVLRSGYTQYDIGKCDMADQISAAILARSGA